MTKEEIISAIHALSYITTTSERLYNQDKTLTAQQLEVKEAAERKLLELIARL